MGTARRRFATGCEEQDEREEVLRLHGARWVWGGEVDQLVNLNAKEGLFVGFDAQDAASSGLHLVQVAQIVPNAGVEEQSLAIGK